MAAEAPQPDLELLAQGLTTVSGQVGLLGGAFRDLPGVLAAIPQQLGGMEQRLGGMEQRLGDLAEGQRQMKQQLGGMEQRSIARTINASLAMDAQLEVVALPDGQQPAGYPATAEALGGMPGQEVDALLVAYGITPPPRSGLERRRALLKRHLGVRTARA